MTSQSKAQCRSSAQRVAALAFALGACACGTDGAAQSGSLTSGGITGDPDAGAGIGGAGTNGSATIPGTTLPLPASCGELGFEVTFGCENCPTEPPQCDCLTLGSALFLPEQSCTWGKCLVDYDCERLCLNLDNMDLFFGQDLMAANECRSAMSRCTEDTECGRGHCAYATTTEPGRCTGAANEPCETEADCMLGLQCVHTPEGSCLQPARGMCNEDVDCETGSRCVIYDTQASSSGEVFQIGGCGTGDEGETCDTTDDCVAPYQCVAMPPQPFGVCGIPPQVP